MNAPFYEGLCNAVDRYQQDGGPQGKRGQFWLTDEEPTYTTGVGDTGLVQHTITRGGLWSAQQRFYESKAFIKAIIGGYGSGKTMTGCKRAIALSLHNAPWPVAIISPSFPMAMKTVIPTIKQLLIGKQTILGHELTWSFKQNPIPEFTINYHGRIGTIWVIGSDNPDSLRGPNLAAAIIDEPFIQDEAVYTQMVSRVRQPGARRREICLCGTPEQMNWGYKLCMGRLGKGMSIEVIRMSTRLNKALDPSIVQNLEATLSARAIRAYVDAEFVDLSEGQVYYGFDPLENIVELPLDESATLSCGMDFNVNPMAAVVGWMAGSHLHVFDEIQLPNSDTEQMAMTLRQKYPRLRKINPDASGKARKTSAVGKTDFAILERYGFEIDAPNANPPIRDRENAVNGKLKPASGRVTLTIGPGCPDLRMYLATYSHKLKNKQKEMSHLLDALGYLVHRNYPIYRGGENAVRRY